MQRVDFADAGLRPEGAGRGEHDAGPDGTRQREVQPACDQYDSANCAGAGYYLRLLSLTDSFGRGSWLVATRSIA